MSRITPQRVRAVIRRLDAMTGEMPSTDGGGGKGSHSDRTGSLAFRHELEPGDPRVDLARRDLDEITRIYAAIIRRQRLGRSVAQEVTRLDELLRGWEMTDRRAERLRAGADDRGQGWCQSHWRWGVVYPPRTEGSKLCAWCEGWLRRFNDPDDEWGGLDIVVVPERMVLAHSERRKVTLRDLPPARRKQTSPPPPHPS
jgi:hypothetical protein